MSFSSDIKQELNKTNSLVNKENVKFELIRLLYFWKYRCHKREKHSIFNRE